MSELDLTMDKTVFIERVRWTTARWPFPSLAPPLLLAPLPWPTPLHSLHIQPPPTFRSLARSQFGVEPARESAGFLVAKMEDASDRLMVFFPEGDVSVKKCKDFMQRLKDEGVSHGILVVSGKFSTLARNSLMDDVKSFHIEHFRDEELLVDITEHELVPLHQPLSDDEKRALLERYKLHETQLPRIQPVDPVARFYGLQRGQVVKIIRPSETAGRYVSYRIVL